MRERVSKTRVLWTTDPEAKGPRFYDMLSPKPRCTLHAVILSPAVVGAYVHWVQGRTFPCQGATGECLPCELHQTRNWKGYIGVQVPSNGRLGIMEVTMNAWHHCPDLRKLAGQLRGRRIKSHRRGDRPNSAVFIEVGEQQNTAHIKPDFDLHEALIRLWGIRPANEYPPEPQQDQQDIPL